MRRIQVLFFVFTFLINSEFVIAVDRTWDGGGGDNNWNTAANWSSDAIPGANDRAIFDATSTKNCIINVTASIKGIWIKSGYTSSSKLTGSITIITSANTNFTLGSDGFVQEAATFTAQAGSNTGFMTVNGPFDLSGGTFVASINSSFLNGGMTKSGGTFTHSSGLVRFGGMLSNNGIFTINLGGSETFYDVTFHTSASYDCVATISSGTTIVVNNTLTLTETSGKKLELITGDVHAKGTIAVAGSGSINGGGSATITVNGTSNQSFTNTASASTSPLPNITINKSSGDFSLNSSQVYTFKNKFTLTSLGGSFSPGTTTVVFVGKSGELIDNSSSKNFSFYNLTATNASSSDTTIVTLSSNDTVNISGNLTMAGPGKTYLNGDGLYLVTTSGTSDGVKLTNTNTTDGGGTSTIQFKATGSNTQTLFGNASGTGFLPNIEVFKAGGTFAVKDIAVLKGTLEFFGSSNYVANKDGATAGIIRCHNDLKIPLSSKINAGTATIEMVGSANQSLSGTTTSGTGKLCIFKINKSGGVLNVDSTINIGTDFEYVAGTVTHSAISLVRVYNSGTFDPQGSSSTMTFRDLSFNNSRTVSGKVICIGDFTIESSTTVTNTSHDFELSGNYTNSGTYSMSGSGKMVFNNTTSKSISGSGTQTFTAMQLNGVGGISLSTPVTISTGAMTFTKGLLTTTNTNILTMEAGTTVSGGDNESFVNGPIKKIGNTSFAFPVGKTNKINPISISAPSNATDAFRAEYFDVEQTEGNDLDDSLEYISSCEHWNLEQLVGSSSVKITLLWDTLSCDIPLDVNDLRIAYWDVIASKWLNYGFVDFTGDNLSGSVTNFATVSTFGFIALAKKKDFLPYNLPKFKYDGNYYLTQNNGFLRVEYPGEYNVSILKFIVYDEERNIVADESNLNIVSSVFQRAGDNRYVFNFSCSGEPLSPGYYTMEIINEKGEKMVLRFKQVYTPSC